MMAMAKTVWLVLVLLLTACARDSGPLLGENLTSAPGWARLKQATVQAMNDPNVWATLAAAALLQVDDLDQRLSDQLIEHTPLFGSQSNAENASDDFASATEIAYVSTALIAPGPDTSSAWISNKAAVLGAEWLTVKSARMLTSGLKDLSSRERPNAENKRSFPSGHATTASSQAAMARLNTQYLPISRTSKQLIAVSFDGLAALTCWARVEAGKHYPADVLAGWAVGHFIANLGQAFIDPQRKSLLISPQLAEGATGLQLTVLF